MDHSTIAVVLNPAAGGGQSLRAMPRINSALQSLGRPYRIYVTKRPGDATDAAATLASQGAGIVIAMGGDGTINEVVNGLLASGTGSALGVLAIGSGSDFARTIETPKSIETALSRIAEGTPRPIDVGRIVCDDGKARAFVNVAGLGFDAIVAERAGGSRLPGSNLPYLSSALITMARFRNIHVMIDADGETISTSAVFVQIANAKYMGGGFKIAPMAEIDDGLLDLAIVGDLTKPDLLRNLPKVYGGTHVSHPKFTHLRVRQVRVESAETAKVQADGEMIGTAPVTFSVDPGALNLVG